MSKYNKINPLLFLNEYGGLQNAIEYYEKAIAMANDNELKAETSYKMLNLYKHPYLTSFHSYILSKLIDKWYSRGIFDSAYIANTPDSLKYIYTGKYNETVRKIDSLYKHTNYFNEVITECGYLYPQPKKKEIVEVIEQKNDLDEFVETDSNNEVFIILFVLALASIFAFLKLKR